jgi:ubiquinone/menaquinone biosynthesis C-methylase UbiE
VAVRVCPVWLGWLLASPIRKLVQNPRKILASHVREGMKALDVGPGMGYFSLSIAEFVGRAGQVVCVDVQEGMLRRLRARARRAGVGDRVATRLASEDSLCLRDLDGTFDFALAFAVAHEVPDRHRLMQEIRAALKPGASFLLAEPVGHVDAAAFADTVGLAKDAGMEMVEAPVIARSRSALFRPL